MSSAERTRDPCARQRRRDRYWTLAAVVLGALGTVAVALYYRHLSIVHPHSHGPGFPMDDAWIHAQFALNFARGYIFQYNPGTYSSGSTSPLWSAIEGIGLLFWSDPVTVAHVLGVLFSILHIVMAVLLARRFGLRGLWLLAVPVLLLAQWRIAWGAVSGMEVPLVNFLVLLTFWIYFRERASDRPAWRTGLAAGALLWSRPEGLLAIALLGADQLYLLARPGPDGDISWGRRLRRLGGLLAGWAALALPLFAINAASGPGIFPQTLYTKARIMTPERGWEQLWFFFVDLMGGDLSWQLLYVAAGYVMVRRLVDLRGGLPQATLPLFVLGWLGGIAFLRGSGDYFSRYLIPCIGLMTLFGLESLWRASQALRLRAVGLVLAVIPLVLQAYPVVRQNARDYALNVASVSGHVVVMGQWADRHLPPEAVIAMSDVGGMSYFTENRVVDMRGLISTFHGWDRLEELERQRRVGVDYALLFPELNERVILRGGYIPIYALTLDANNISATDNLVVYRTPWTDERRLRRVGRSFDFEDGTYQRWITLGCFRGGLAEGERSGQRRIINLGGGRWFLTSWGAQGDHDRGRAISPQFRIEGDIMTVRVGGGRLPGRAGVRLWVDDHIERTAVGSRSEVLVQREWDVGELRGRSARIEVFDEATGSWGHILFDEMHQYVVESGEAPRLIAYPPEGPQEPAESIRAAEQRGLDSYIQRGRRRSLPRRSSERGGAHMIAPRLERQ